MKADSNRRPKPIDPSKIRCKVKEYQWGSVYVGSKEGLLASGLFKPGWFPGARGRAKTYSSVTLPNGRKITIERGSRNSFTARWLFTKEELDRNKSPGRPMRPGPGPLLDSEHDPRQRAIIEANTLPDPPPSAATVAATAVYDAIVQLKGCTGLMRFALVDMQQRVGDSSKLARAYDDINGASINLRRVAAQLEALLP